MKRLIILSSSIVAFMSAGYFVYRFVSKSDLNPNPKCTLDQPLDSLNGVIVYYNGMVGRTEGRNVAPDGYNIGMKHQCVEFVKRYYYERLHHKMPDSYGNAKDFFDITIPDSGYNNKRGLLQFTNNSKCKPQVEDLAIFDGHASNPYGHVAIVAFVCDSFVSVIQQNPGPFGQSRDTFGLGYSNNKWRVNHPRLLGWLRKDTVAAPSIP